MNTPPLPVATLSFARHAMRRGGELHVPSELFGLPRKDHLLRPVIDMFANDGGSEILRPLDRSIAESPVHVDAVHVIAFDRPDSSKSWRRRIAHRPDTCAIRRACRASWPLACPRAWRRHSGRGGSRAGPSATVRPYVAVVWTHRLRRRARPVMYNFVARRQQALKLRRPRRPSGHRSVRTSSR